MFKLATEILFDKYFSLAMKDLLIAHVNEQMKSYFKNNSSDLLTLHPFAERVSHEVLGGIATGKSTTVNDLLTENKQDCAFINTDVIAGFLQTPTAKPYEYLSFQLAYDEILLVKLIINKQFELLANAQQKLPNCILESIYSQPHLKHLMLREGGKLNMHIQTAADPLATVERAFNRCKTDNRYMASSVVLFTQKEGSAQLAEKKLEYHTNPVDLISQMNPQMRFEIKERTHLIATCDHQKFIIYDKEAWNNYLKNIHINYHYQGTEKLYPLDVEKRILESMKLICQALEKKNIKLVDRSHCALKLI